MVIMIVAWMVIWIDLDRRQICFICSFVLIWAIWTCIWGIWTTCIWVIWTLIWTDLGMRMVPHLEI